MLTFRDFPIWYNNLDVQPFCDALEKMCLLWKDKDIDMLRQKISIPGVTLTFTTLESGIFFLLFDEKNKDLYYLFKKTWWASQASFSFAIMKQERQKSEIKRDRGKRCQCFLSMGHYTKYANRIAYET